jgi:predicted enzyme related to lactoylglutathione lyase
VINGVHLVVFADDATAARGFFRDVLGWDWVDAHDGWLIFQLPPAELGVHPGPPGGNSHQIYLMCEDLPATVAELAAAGVEFTTEITEAGFGRQVGLAVPGAGQMFLYQPRHATALGTVTAG